MTTTTTVRFHADRDLDCWDDDCLYAHVFDADGCLVAKVCVGTRHGTNGGSASRTAADDSLLGEARLQQILDALNA